MSTSIRLKKSAVSSNAPTTGDIDYGELAINYADGKLYYKTSSNTIDYFGSVGAGGGGSSLWTQTGSDIYYNTGNVGIGVTDPGEALEVDGNVEITGEFIGDLRGPVTFKAQAGENLTLGDAVYISGVSGQTSIVSKADADDAAKMPAFGLVSATTTSGNPCTVVTFGSFIGYDTVNTNDSPSWALGDTLYVSTVAGEITNVPPAGESALIQNIGKVQRIDASDGRIKVGGAGRTNATPNLNEGRLFVGNASNRAVADDTVHIDIANARVGIGTTNPTTKLDIRGTSNTVASTIGIVGTGISTLLLGQNADGGVIRGQGGSNALSFWTGGSGDTAAGGSGSERMRIDSSGDVGIGTSSPAFKLQVVGASQIQTNAAGTQQVLQLNNSDTTAGTQAVKLGFSSAGTTKASINAAVYGNDYMTFNVGSDTERMRIDGAGNVGIGTASPAHKLSVFGDSSGNRTEVGIDNIDQRLVLGAYFETGVAQYSTIQATDNAETTATNLILQPDGGNVGIGTTAPAKMLHIESTAGNQLRLAYNSSFYWDIEREAATGALTFTDSSNGEIMRIDDAGNVGIGKTSPAAPLHIERAGDTSVWLTDTTVTNYGGFISGRSVAFQGGYLDLGTVQNGAEVNVITINHSHYVGVGTTTPLNKLQTTTSAVASVPAAGSSGHAFAAGSSAYGLTGGALTNGNAYLQVTRWDGTGTNYNMLLNPNGGNVGIGTGSPAYTLDVTGTIRSTGALWNDDAINLNRNGAGYVRHRRIDQSLLLGVTNTAGTLYYPLELNPSSNFVKFSREGGIETMRIDSAGRVGIGASNPTSLLHMSSTGPAILTIEADTDNVTETDNARIVLKQDGGAVVGRIGYADGTNSLEIINEYAENLYLGTSNGTDVTINSSGNVGIGTSSPTYKLVVSNGGAEGIEFHPGSGTNISSMYFYSRDVPAYDEARIYSENMRFFTGTGTESLRLFSTYTQAYKRLDIKGFATGNNTISTSTGSLGELEIEGNGTGAAMMAFHRPGSHAGYFGLDTDNRWKIGGWSLAGASYQVILGDAYTGNSAPVCSTSADRRVKWAVWGTDEYGMGMGNSYTFGGLTNYAMSFQMNTTAGRGFWWGNAGHTNAQGAMSLTTTGLLTIASGCRIGYGESDTTAPSAGLQVSGAITATSNLTVGSTATASNIYMGDTDEGARTIHCNSNRIGFLNQSSGWGSFCNDDGSWGSTNRIYVGFDSGVTNSMSCSDWFRSNNSTGWYNQSYAGGIYMQDTTWVRIYNNKAFYVGNQIAASGNITAYYSDERLKTKVSTIENALDKVVSLEGFVYVENEKAKELGYNNDKQQVGVSAQAVQKVLPEAVSLAPVDMETHKTTGEITSKSGENYLTVDYARLVPLLVESIKELSAKNEELENRLKKLEDKD